MLQLPICTKAVGTAASPADVAGLLTQMHDYSEDGEYTYNGTITSDSQNLLVDVDVRPFAIFRAEVRAVSTQELTCSAASTDCTPGTAIGAADVLGGCFCYDSTEGELRFVEDNDATTGFTFNTAATNAWEAANTQFIIPQRFYGQKANQGLTYVTGTATAESKVLCEGNETTLWVNTLDMFYKEAQGSDLVRLLPKHDAISLTSPTFYIDFVIRDHMFNPLS